MAEQDVDIDLMFGEIKPEFGDLFTLTGRVNPRVPPLGYLDLTALASLGYDQIDDYFGIPNEEWETGGSDVLIWLFPLVRKHAVAHHRGPFDGVRLSYDTPVEGRPLLLDHRPHLLSRSIQALLPMCNAVLVDGVTIASGASLDFASVIAKIDAARRV